MKDITEVFKTPDEFLSLKDKTPEEIKDIFDKDVATITLEQAKALKELVSKIANKDFSENDRKVLKMIASSDDSELNEEELTSVAGGDWNWWSYTWRVICTIPAGVADVAGWIFDGIADNKAHDSWTDKMWSK